MNEDRPARGLFNVGVDPTLIWCLGKTIGKGAFGYVHVAVSILPPQRKAAVKLISVEDPDDVDTIRKEVKILTSCNHPNVVAFDNTYLNGETLWLVMEYCGGGSVADLLRFRQLHENEIAHVLFETLNGLSHLHQQNIIHRDLKSANLLLTKNGKVKVADFGVSKILETGRIKTRTFVGTPHWMAPEIIVGKEYDARCDLWSIGIVGIELAEQHPPKYQINMHGVLAAIPKAPAPKLQNPVQWNPSFIEFVGLLLVKDPANRPTAERALSFDFVMNGNKHEAQETHDAQKTQETHDNKQRLKLGQSMLISFIEHVCDAKKNGKLPPKPRRRAVRQGGFTFSSSTTVQTIEDETRDSISDENDKLLGNWDTATMKTSRGNGGTTRTQGGGSGSGRTHGSSSSSKYGTGYTQSSLLSRAGSTRTLQSVQSSHSSWSSLSDSKRRIMSGQSHYMYHQPQQQQQQQQPSERTALYSNDALMEDPFAKGNELNRTVDTTAAALLCTLDIVQETAEEEAEEEEDNVDEKEMLDNEEDENEPKKEQPEQKEEQKIEDTGTEIETEQPRTEVEVGAGNAGNARNTAEKEEEDAMWDRIVLQRVSMGFSKEYGASKCQDERTLDCIEHIVEERNTLIHCITTVSSENIQTFKEEEHVDVAFMRELLQKCAISIADVKGQLYN